MKIFWEYKDKLEEIKKEKPNTTDYFSGTLGEIDSIQRVKEFSKVLELSAGQPWETLIRTIWLLDNSTTKFDLLKVLSFSEEQKDEFFKIILNGVLSFHTLGNWVSPLKKNEFILQAIYDAIQVGITFGDDRYTTFQILDMGTCTHIESAAAKLYDFVLEIKSPIDVVKYIKQSNLPESLVVTFQPHPDPDKRFKGTFYLFLVYNGHLYSIANPERRLDYDNTAGMRRPDRYVDRKYDHVWLPFELLWEQSKTMDQIIPNTPVFRVMNFDVIKDKHPEIFYWLNMFTIRTIYEIERNIDKILIGVSTSSVGPLLEDLTKQKKILERIESESIVPRNEYLIKEYGSKLTEIVPVDIQTLPMVIGTERYIKELTEFEQRKKLADQIEEEVLKEYHEKKAEIRDWWFKFVESYNYDELINKVLKEDRYPMIMYNWCEYEQTLTEEEKQEIAVRHGEEYWYRISGFSGIPELYYGKIGMFKVLRSTKSWYFSGSLGREHSYRSINLFKIKPRKLNMETLLCQTCLRYKYKQIFEVVFKDWRQIVAFFGIKEGELPPIVKTHLHQAQESYIGNTILDDTDPVDSIEDPWFREEYDGSYRWGKSSGGDMSFGDEKSLSFFFAICNRDFNKIRRRLGFRIREPKVEIEEEEK